MNKIVHQHIRAAELPDRLRSGIDKAALVTVTVEEESKDRRPTREQLKALLEEARTRAQGKGVTTEDAVDRIRTLRDEWDD